MRVLSSGLDASPSRRSVRKCDLHVDKVTFLSLHRVLSLESFFALTFATVLYLSVTVLLVGRLQFSV